MGRAKYPRLFAPLRVGSVRFKNRVLTAPVPLSSPLDPQRLEGFESRARGGYGGVSVAAWDASEDLAPLAEAVRDHGALACVLLSAGPGESLEQWAALAGARAAQGFQVVGVADDGGADMAAVCREVRRACGPEVVVQYCLREAQPGEDAGFFEARVQAAADEADLICVEAEGTEAALALAEAVKSSVSLPVGAMGNFTDPDEIEMALGAGKCDFVMVTGEQLAEPDFMRKLLQGMEDEIVPCLSCARCGALEGGHCPVRPQSGQELRWRCASRPGGKRRVMVAGAGPAGLYAAATAAERGHDVILVESCRQPGGLLWYTSVDGSKRALRRFRDGLIARCTRLGVKFQLGTTVSAGYLAQMRPDALICAVGGAPARPDVPGVERAHHVLYGYDKPEQVGRRVVIIGGGLAGCESALWLAGQGRQVLLLEMDGELAPGASREQRAALLDRLRQRVAWDCAVRVEEVSEEGVRFVDSGGEVRSVPADCVLYAVGQRPCEQVVEQLREGCDWMVPVGGCAGARDVGQAVRQGFCAAMDIL